MKNFSGRISRSKCVFNGIVDLSVGIGFQFICWLHKLASMSAYFNNFDLSFS